MHLHRVANASDLQKKFKYYESYPHIALVCSCPEKTDSRIKTYFFLNTQFPCHTQTLNC